MEPLEILWKFTHEDLGKVEGSDSVFGDVPVYRSRLRVQPFVREGDVVREATDQDGVTAHEATADIPTDMADLSASKALARLGRDEERYGIPMRLLLALLGHHVPNVFGTRVVSAFPPEQP